MTLLLFASIITGLYAFVCFMWAAFAADMQKKFYPNSSFYKIEFVYIVNIIFCPICILIASLMLLFDKGWAKRLKVDENV